MDTLERKSLMMVDRLIQSAFRVISEKGIGALTLAGVAAEAGVSKGALLHHFSNKSVLLQHVVRASQRDFVALVVQQRGDDAAPGSWTRAYVRAALDPKFTGNTAARALYYAPLAEDGDVRGILQEASDYWRGLIERDGIDPAKAQAARLAADGCWWLELAGLTVFETGDDRARLVDQIIAGTR